MAKVASKPAMVIVRDANIAYQTISLKIILIGKLCPLGNQKRIKMDYLYLKQPYISTEMLGDLQQVMFYCNTCEDQPCFLHYQKLNLKG